MKTRDHRDPRDVHTSDGPAQGASALRSEFPVPSGDRGTLTSIEIEELWSRFRSGAHGELLIGMQRRRRMFPLWIGPAGTEASSLRLLEENGVQIRRMGADGFIHVRRVRVRSRGRRSYCMLVHQQVQGNEQRLAFPLGAMSPAGGASQWFKSDVAADLLIRLFAIGR